MEHDSVIEKISTLLANAQTLQQLTQRSVDLIMREMEKRDLVATSIYKINEEKQTMEAFAYAIKGGKAIYATINALLPKQFDQIALPLDTKDNLTLEIARTSHVQQSPRFADFSHGAVPDSIAHTVDKILGGKLTIGFPIPVSSRKVAGVVLFMFTREKATEEDREMMETFARQIGKAFAHVTSLEHIAVTHKKDLQRMSDQKDPADMDTVRFTLRISPNNDKKLEQLAKQKGITKAEVIREFIEKN